MTDNLKRTMTLARIDQAIEAQYFAAKTGLTKEEALKLLRDACDQQDKKASEKHDG